MHTRTKQRKTCNIFHLSFKIKGLTAVNSSHSSCQLPWLGSHLSKMKRREIPPAAKVLSTRIHTWTNLENLVEWTPVFRTITTDLPTLTILCEPHDFLPFLIASWQNCQSQCFLGNGNFVGNASTCLSEPWWHLAVSFVPSDLFPSLL